jgi:hypothetical protein
LFTCFSHQCGHLQGGAFTKDNIKITTLREKRRLRVFENKVLRRIFGPKRDKLTGEWRILHIEELNDLHY